MHNATRYLLSVGDFPNPLSILTHIKYSTHCKGVEVVQKFAGKIDYVRGCMIQRSNLIKKEIFSSPKVHNSSGAHVISKSMNTGDPSPGLKHPVNVVADTPRSSTKVKAL